MLTGRNAIGRTRKKPCSAPWPCILTIPRPITAWVYAQRDDTQRAYEYLQRALAARPAYPEALNNLGILYLRTGRPEDAKRSFAESMRVAPDYAQAYLNLSRVYAMEGDKVKARAPLEELLKIHPDNAQARKELDELTP